MNSEFYPGWFDQWGRNHSLRAVRNVTAALAALLADRFSVSLYMAHGGAHCSLLTAHFIAALTTNTIYLYDTQCSQTFAYSYITSKVH